MKKRVFAGRIALLAGLLILTVFAVLYTAMPETYSFVEGEISPVDIYAIHDVEDTVTTNRQMAAAVEQVKPRYKIDADVNNRLLKSFDETMEAVRTAAALADSDEALKLSVAKSAVGDKLGDDTLLRLLRMGESELAETKGLLKAALEEVLTQGVQSADEVQPKLEQVLAATELSPAQLSAAQAVLPLFIEKNQFYDEAATAAERERVKSLVTPTIYKKNQVIVRKGELITEGHLAMLSALGLMKDMPSVNMKYAAGVSLLFLTLFLLVFFYMHKKEKAILRDGGRFYLFCVLYGLEILMLLFAAIFGQGEYLDLFLPVSAGAILLAIFIDLPFSFLMTMVFQTYGALLFDTDIIYFIGMLLVGVIGALVFSRATSFGTFSVSAVLLSLVQGGIYVTCGLLSNLGLAAIGRLFLIGIVGGLLASVVVVGTMPFWQMLFDIITPFKLAELASPEKKLLRRLLFEAPGTYHHSLMVGNLAEAAAEQIGANAMLARVGSYYHDIGKLKRPLYFKENQLGENPHDNLLPAESAAILSAHPQHGMELARQYHLPAAIREIIAQHHGTTQVGMFYQKAVDLFGREAVAPEDYQYPGPKPQTKEAALVMLADSCEAAVRALDDKSPRAVGAMIDKIVQAKLAVGQLDESDLTLKDIERSKLAFAEMFEGYFHQRIKYEKFGEGDGANG